MYNVLVWVRVGWRRYRKCGVRPVSGTNTAHSTAVQYSPVSSSEHHQSIYHIALFTLLPAPQHISWLKLTIQILPCGLHGEM